MRRENEDSVDAHSASGVGACLLALLSGVARQADDVARVAARPVGGFSRTAARQMDDVGSVLLRAGDDALPHLSRRPAWRWELPDHTPSTVRHNLLGVQQTDGSEPVRRALEEVLKGTVDAATAERSEE